MNLSLTSKVVLVTGSTRGIGFYIATKFIEEGAVVIFNGRSESSRVELCSKFPGKEIFYLKGDVTKAETCKKMALEVKELFGKLDVLVCNVGSGKSVPPGEEDDVELYKMLNINLFSSFNIVDATKNLLSIDSGSVVCISSICGREVIDGAPIAYSVAKAALDAYVRGSSRPLAGKGIRINSISLGNILFDGSVWEKKLIQDESTVRKMINEKVALGRFGQLDDVANLTLFLSSNLSKFVTGSIYVLDGGQVHQ